MWKHPWWGKLAALGGVIIALLLALQAISGVVTERQWRQREAEQSVANALAGQQTLLGPVLQRECRDTWLQWEGTGADRKQVAAHSDLRQSSWPTRVDVVANSEITPRYRGVFKLSSYLARQTITAKWAQSSWAIPASQHASEGGVVRCDPVQVAVGLSDARGIQVASVKSPAGPLQVAAGSELGNKVAGFHAEVPEGALATALTLEIGLDLAGTRSLAWVPLADETVVKLESNWPHPSFQGRFLPGEREVAEKGFSAQWKVSSLATTARDALMAGGNLCALSASGSGGNGSSESYGEVAASAGGSCLDSFGTSFIDPVGGYTLSDRAVKYGVLFIALTFVGVGLTELVRRLRVHPMQYLLVGSALTLFFLLLLSLSEHIGFAWAYLAASAASCGLLSFYGLHILGGWRPGAVFGAGIATLYGVLYALLQMEQTALVLGSGLLFAVLAAVMVATRRLDWYSLGTPRAAAAPAGMPTRTPTAT